ncbi:MAG TPA: alanine--glyoxylate aminotransferase family protein [Synergistaceae bacterium]|nr:alanine--glyoxylate aminotransferase family protein [Synergistaceae bacterium]
MVKNYSGTGQLRRGTLDKILLGPGPSTVESRVLRALSEPTMGYLDSDFLAIMDETKNLLKYVFQTENDIAIAVSGTGSAGMETACVNMIEPGDKVIVCVHGYFGQRLAQVAERCGADVVTVSSSWGRPVDPEDVRKAIKATPGAKALGIVHAETSTGVLQPLGDVAKIAHDAGLFMIVDAVTSLGGVEVPVDKFSLDVVYSGSQKCLGSPPGLAPLTANGRAMEAIRKRKVPVQSWYFDLTLLARYWGDERLYHHTAPANMIYALNESLRIVAEEGIEKRWERHLKNAKALAAGLEAMGLKLLVDEPYRLPSLITVKVPEGIDEAALRKQLMSVYGIEVGSGLGELKGKILRIGLMGSSSNNRNIILLLAALGSTLRSMGFAADLTASLDAARSAQ